MYNPTQPVVHTALQFIMVNKNLVKCTTKYTNYILRRLVNNFLISLTIKLTVKVKQKIWSAIQINYALWCVNSGAGMVFYEQ